MPKGSVQDIYYQGKTILKEYLLHMVEIFSAWKRIALALIMTVVLIIVLQLQLKVVMNIFCHY